MMKAYDKQYIDGRWREGRGEKILEDRNPYTGGSAVSLSLRQPGGRG